MSVSRETPQTITEMVDVLNVYSAFRYTEYREFAALTETFIDTFATYGDDWGTES